MSAPGCVARAVSFVVERHAALGIFAVSTECQQNIQPISRDYGVPPWNREGLLILQL